MANLAFNAGGKTDVLAGSSNEIDLINNTIKVLALETDDDPDDPDVVTVADLLVDGAEVTSTGYTGGHGGAGRLSLSSKAIAVDQANDRGEFDHANLTWSSISQATSETWSAIAWFKELASDAASRVIIKVDTATGLPLTPNGSDITLTIDAEGIYHLT